MQGTAVYSSAAIWQKNRKWFIGICIFMILLTAFGRNWVGVHTPLDVGVGILVALLVVFCQYHMLLWVEKWPQKDIIVLIISIIWTAALLLFTQECEKACGIFLGVYIGWFVERRWIHFEIKGTLIRRILHYVLGMGFVLVMYKVLLPVLASPFSSIMQTFIINGFTFFSVTALWPAILRLSQKEK